MANNSAIEWTDTTWNPLAGCTRASSGCDHCYAATMARRLEAMALSDIENGKSAGRKVNYIGLTSKTKNGNVAFNGKIALVPGALQDPYTWKTPRLVFVNSMSDLFHKDVPFEYVARVYDVMRITPKHTYQVLTKRPVRAVEFYREYPQFADLKNIWFGTSVEDQTTADERIPELLKVPSVTRFLSCEPLLDKVCLQDYLDCKWDPEIYDPVTGRNGSFTVTSSSQIHWVVAGGESGPKARPIEADWVRSLRDQCTTSKVAFFFKQWGGKNKKQSGRLLDGRTWDEMPKSQ